MYRIHKDISITQCHQEISLVLAVELGAALVFETNDCL